MTSQQVVISEGKLYLTAKNLALYYDVSAPTITAYKKKGLTPTIFKGDKTQYFEIKHADEIKLAKVKDRHSQQRESQEVDIGDSKEDKIVFPDGRRFYQMDMDDPEDVELISLHVLGEMYLDRMKSAEDIKAKQHALKVKKKEYLLMVELDQATAETFARTRSMLVSMRDQLPIIQIEKLIKEKLIKQEDKQLSQKIIADEADSLFKEGCEDLDDGLLKRNPKSIKATKVFLENLLKKYK